MPALNRVQLIGRLGKDPESRFTPTGKQVTTFSLAVSNRWKSKGETKEYTEWINVEAWGRLGEVCQEYLKKGSLVYRRGTPENRPLRRQRRDQVFHESQYAIAPLALCSQLN